MQLPEPVLLFIDSQSGWFSGFIMAGVILILVGVKNVTLKEMKDYKALHPYMHKIDEVVAWGIFYIIFGILIAAGAIISIINFKGF